MFSVGIITQFFLECIVFTNLFLCLAMLGIDISVWKNDTAQALNETNGILETAALISSVFSSDTTSSTTNTIMTKEQHTEMYRCRFCNRLFCSQSDFAIHVRGHLVPSSAQPFTRRGKRGRPWVRAGTVRPFGKRGPGRPRKVKLEEEGADLLKDDAFPRRRGRPRKHPLSESEKMVEDEEMSEIDGEDKGNDVKCQEAKIEMEQNSSLEETKKESLDGFIKDGDANVQSESMAADSEKIVVDEYQTDISVAVPNEENHTVNSLQQTSVMRISEGGHSNMFVEETATLPPKRGRGRPRSKTLSEQTDIIQAAPISKEVTTEQKETINTLQKKRGRPPRKEKGEVSTSPPRVTAASGSPRRVQPRRALKGKRTSTFRYPGESDSEEEEEVEEEKKVKGRNVLKKLIQSSLSDDDSEESELEEGEIRVTNKDGEGIITVHTSNGIMLSETPIILVDENTNQIIHTSASQITTAFGTDGKEVVILQTAMESNDGLPTANTDNSVALVTADKPAEGNVNTQQDALFALVDAALSSQKIAGLVEDEGQEPTNVKMDENADTASDDPDWDGTRESSSKRRQKRRRGDDPELEELEDLIQSVEVPGGKKEYVCGVCAKHFQQLKYLKLHLPAHTDKFRCNSCGRRFARHESLQKHSCEGWVALVEKVEVEEDGSVLFRCKECGRTFPQWDHARRHTTLHKGTWACEKCQNTFPKRQLLLEHICGQVRYILLNWSIFMGR